MKRTLLAVLLLSLLATVLAPAAGAAATILYESDFSYNDSTEEYELYYTAYSDGAVKITGEGAMNEVYAFMSGSLPRNGTMGEMFFTSVTVGDGVTALSEGAFGWNYGLTEASIGKSIETIPADTFYDCNALTSITLPAALTLIDTDAFGYCDSLTDVYFKGTKQQWKMVAINNGNTAIFGATIHCSDGDYAYDLAYTIDDDGVMTFTGTGYFDEYMTGSEITKVVINDGLIGMDTGLFTYCYDLTAFEVSSSNNFFSAKNGVLFNKDKTALLIYPDGKTGSYSVPSGVKEIGSYAFCGADVSSITLPSSLESISYAAFWGCSGFSSITLPANVEEIDFYAFTLCTDLTAFKVSSSNGYFSAKDGVLFNKDKTALLACPYGKTGAYSVPSGVEYIGDCAFYYCDALTSIVLPDSVSAINSNAFAYCTSMSEFSFSENVYYIGYGIFDSCYALETVNYGGTMEEFEALTEDRTNADIPLHLAKIVCSDGNITPEAYTGYLNYWEEKVPFTLTKTGKLTVSGAGEWDVYAFMDNTMLKEATLESGVDEIGYGAFMWCTNLKKITIPASVKTIYNMAFYGSQALEDVYYAGTVAQWEKLLADSIENADYDLENEYEALSWTTVHCSDADWKYDGDAGDDGDGDELTADSFDMVLPKKITEIDAQAFSGSAITNIYIPYGCKKINKWAFKDCESLRVILIPSSVSFIADDAFEGCDSTLTFVVGEDNDYAKNYAQEHGFVAVTSALADAPAE